MFFSPHLGVERGGGALKGLGNKLLMKFSTLCSSKLEVFEPNVFDILTIHNEQTSYVKHGSDPLHVIFTLFGCLEGASYVHCTKHNRY